MQPDVCHCSKSQDWPRRRSWGQSCRCIRALPEEDHQSWSPPLSLTGSHWQVTFLDPGTTSEEEQALEQASTDLDLGPLPELGPDLKCFLQEPTIMQGEDGGSDLSQGPLAEDYKDWIEWRGHRDGIPNWWQELVGIPGINDFWELTQKIRASFELPWVKSETQDVKNDYLAPPAPKCICQKEFLPPLNPIFPCQDIRDGQSQKTLAYAPSPTVLGGEVQPTYARLTTHFGEVCAGSEKGDGAICGLFWWCHPGGCHTSGEVPGRTNLGNYSWEDPADPHQGACWRADPCWGFPLERQPLWKSPLRRHPYRGAHWGGGAHRGAQWVTNCPKGHHLQASRRVRYSPCVAWGQGKGRSSP